MLLAIKFLAKIFSILNSRISPSQIAAGFCYGMVIGLIPLGSLLPYAFLLIGLIINFNLAALFLGAGLFKIVGFFADSTANEIGYYFLTKIPSLEPFWTKLYNTPIVPYTRFNNTIVLGSLVVGLIAFIPLFLLTILFIKKYRSSWQEKFLKLKIVQIIRASTFYKYYLTYRGLRGDA